MVQYLCYGQENREILVRFVIGKDFSFLQNGQTGCGAYATGGGALIRGESTMMVTGSLSRGKAAGSWRWSPIHSNAEVKERI